MTSAYLVVPARPCGRSARTVVSSGDIRSLASGQGSNRRRCLRAMKPRREAAKRWQGLMFVQSGSVTYVGPLQAPMPLMVMLVSETSEARSES